MNPSSYEGILQDASLAPLQRNKACLQCKRRKVKCTGDKPHCAPCLRSHAHAVRAANRAGTAPPHFSCDWADVDDDSSPDAMEMDRAETSEIGSRRSSDHVHVLQPKKKVSSTVKSGVEKERQRRKDEEKEILLARIADLEARLAGLTPPTDSTTGREGQNVTGGARTEYIQPLQSASNTMPFVDSQPSTTLPSSAGLVGNGNVEDWDFSSFFLVPINWPKNLPAPYLLEHLIDTFFSHVPQAPRMLHRAKLLARIKLPVDHPDFPYPALLHAICAQAAQHTAWVTALPPAALENVVQSTMRDGGDLEMIADFAIAQAESARRSIQQQSAVCMMGPGQIVLEMTQAQALISEVYLLRGFPLMGWTASGGAGRFIKGLELLSRNTPKRYKAALLPPATNQFEREERLGLVWHAFVMEAFWAIGSYWAPSIDYTEVRCKMPTSAAAFYGKGEITPNPQYAHDEDVYRSHPVEDSFVLVCKAAMLCSRAAAFLRKWSQRDIVPGDEMEGMQDPDFIAIVRDIRDFQTTTPATLKNIFRVMDGPATGVNDANILSLHIMPNIAVCLIYEPFLDWSKPDSGPVFQVQKAYEAIIGLIHVIPSNLDVSIILSPVVMFNLYVCGRFIADFVRFALQKQAYGLAVRYRADIMTIQALMNRFGDKHPLGIFVSSFLEMYLETVTKDASNDPNENQICVGVNQRMKFGGSTWDARTDSPSGSSSSERLYAEWKERPDRMDRNQVFNDIAAKAWVETQGPNASSTRHADAAAVHDPLDPRSANAPSAPVQGLAGRARAAAEAFASKFTQPDTSAYYGTGLTPLFDMPPSTPDLITMLNTTPDSSSNVTPPLAYGGETQLDFMTDIGININQLDPAANESMQRGIRPDVAKTDAYYHGSNLLGASAVQR